MSRATSWRVLIFVGQKFYSSSLSRYTASLSARMRQAASRADGWDCLVANGRRIFRDDWSTRVFAEFAGTSCQFYESSELFNCAYNHGIYQTGYRYRARSIGHGADNDARIVSIGVLLVNGADTQWRSVFRFGSLNRSGAPDPRHSLSATKQEIASVDFSHSRVFIFGVIDLGAGHERVDDIASGFTYSDSRAYIQWRSSY